MLMSITFNMILRGEQIDPGNVRLVRHHDTRPQCKITPYELWRRSQTNPALLEKYQNIQRKDRFRVGEFLASFVRTPSGKTLFVGLYTVNGKGRTAENETDPCSVSGMVLYNTNRDDGLKDMKGRLVIDWGRNYRSWHQLAGNNDKKVIELLCDPEEQPFPGYFDFN
jgi:hypothetical protein